MPQRPAVRTARQYLEHLLASTARREGTPLPPSAVLARGAGVCQRSMGAALRQLAAESRVTVKWGRPAIVGRPAVSTPTAAPVSPAWRRTAQQIEQDCRHGRMRGLAALPSSKQLQQDYGVNYRTLAKALDSLCRSGVLERERSRYRTVAATAERRFVSTVLLLTPFALAEAPRFIDPSLHCFVRALENECAQSGVRVIAASSLDSDRDVRKALTSDSLLGVVVFAPHPGLFDKVLLGYAGPVSIFESRASYKASDLPDFASNKRAFSFHIDEVAAGEHVGRFLSRCGYRRPVFISAHADWQFSAQRLEGLSVVYCGDLGGRETPRTVFHGGESAAILNKAAAVARAELPDITGSPGLYRDGDLLRRLLEDSSPSRYRFMEIYERVLSDELAPLFKQALLERGDVWVCVNDQEAVQALRFLRHNRTRVPADLGVVAFDNTDEASYASLSSYDFDIKGLVPRMLDVVLRPGAQQSADAGKRVFVHTGMVVQRASLAVRINPGRTSTK